AGRGIGAVEVPRGILYHDHIYGEDGRVVKANCVIPTTQNHANIQHDIEALAAEHAGRGTSDTELEKL
ncbi:MAG: Ni/Fe hydrogenase subunit alpha, partial [Deltaproteobacteria bacterium]|nr:Ni/Fe hydrogenase subunit alpha [Deltaproteobacteria bacterium]